MEPIIKNDAVVFGILMLVLCAVLSTSASKRPFFQKIYKYIPALLLCYFIPALLRWPLGLISSEGSKIYPFVSRYLLPASLLLFCIGLDMKGLARLGPKAIGVFLAGTFGVIIGGPIAFYLVIKLFPSILPLPPTELWAGLSTIGGSWIGGGANQTAIKEIFSVNDTLFGMVVIVDTLVANIWMGILLYSAGHREQLDKWLKADYRPIEELKNKSDEFLNSVERIPDFQSILLLMTITFAGVGLSHLGADLILPWMKTNGEWLQKWRLTALDSSFFWIVVISTSIGILASLTKARSLEGVGASKWATLFLYILVASIGMQMDLSQMVKNAGLIVVGFIWMFIHILCILIVARLLKASSFYVAVGSMANIGGAASAPVVASAFGRSLAPVGVLLAVLGYAIGTYGGLICAYLLEWVSN